MLNHNKNFNCDIKLKIRKTISVSRHFTRKCMVEYFRLLEVHDLINLVYISKHLRALVLIKFDKYYKLSTSFCDFGQWKKKYVTIYLIF